VKGQGGLDEKKGRPEDVVVVGGGLAGITAALACADAGLQVSLIETRPRLGGRTASFRRDSSVSGLGGGFEVDTGQHVFLRCCVAYLALLHRLGVDDQVQLQPRLDVPVLTPGATGPVRITRGRAPAPLHLAPALARYRLLSPRRRLRLLRAALALRRVDPARPETDDQAFGDWLAAHGQDDETIAALWDLITVATLNSPARDSSLALAATVFQLGLLTDRTAGDLGWSRIPLGRLHGEAARGRLTEAAVTVRTGVRVSGLGRRPGGWEVSLTGAPPIAASQVILAVPAPAAERLLPTGALALPDGWSDRLSSSPIVNVHVVYDRPVLTEPFLAAVGSPVQWVFDRTAASGLSSAPNRVQYLAVSLSAARDTSTQPAQQVIDRIVPALAALLPTAQPARVLDAFVTREPTATFAPSPGTARWRPAPSTAEPGLYLAGAWTATGWPDTMEGAVRSGNSAAAALIANRQAHHPDRPERTEVPA
jgi:squalene-associated FAD-dependent desaturase